MPNTVAVSLRPPQDAFMSKNILVADDDPAICTIIVKALEAVGITVAKDLGKLGETAAAVMKKG